MTTTWTMMMTWTTTTVASLLLAGCNPLGGSPILGRWTFHSDTTPVDGPILDLELILADDGSARFSRIEDWPAGCLDAMQLDGTFALPQSGQVTFTYTGGWYVTSAACIGGAYAGDPPQAELEWRSVTQPWSAGQNTLVLGGTQVPATYIGD